MATGEPNNHWIELNGIRLHALEWPGDGPTILCTHGLAYNAWLFGPVGRAFSPEYRVISLDLRGHGDSDKPLTGYHYTDQAADLAEVVAAIGGPSPILLAHSHGGRIGLHAVAQRPELYAGLMLADTSLLRPQAESERTRRVRYNMTEARFADWDAYLSTMRRSRFHRNWTPDQERFLRFNVEEKPDGSIGPKLPPEAAAESYRCLEAYDLEPDFATIRIPAALIRGGEGNTTPEMVDALRRSMPQLLIEEIPGANHNIALDAPDEFVAAVRRVLAAWAGEGVHSTNTSRQSKVC